MQPSYDGERRCVAQEPSQSLVTDFLITCEHGGNRIPVPYVKLFQGYGALLRTHRGYDIGALVMAWELARKRVVHIISSRSFTPELDGQLRNADIGLLYDPHRTGEVELCRQWQGCLQAKAPHLKVRRNCPCQGKAGGLTSHLRRRYPPAAYVGIEVEINQKHVRMGRSWRALRALIAQALQRALTNTRHCSTVSGSRA